MQQSCSMPVLGSFSAAGAPWWFWVCVISDELLNLHWTVTAAALGSCYQHPTRLKFVRMLAETSHWCQQLSQATFVTILSHRHDSPSLPNASGRLSSPRMAHFSCADCFQEAPEWDPRSCPLGEGALWSIFARCLCCKSLKEKISQLSCHLPITQPQRWRECTRLAPWWEGGSAAGAHIAIHPHSQQAQLE